MQKPWSRTRVRHHHALATFMHCSSSRTGSITHAPPSRIGHSHTLLTIQPRSRTRIRTPLTHVHAWPPSIAFRPSFHCISCERPSPAYFANFKRRLLLHSDSVFDDLILVGKLLKNPIFLKWSQDLTPFPSKVMTKIPLLS